MDLKSMFSTLDGTQRSLDPEKIEPSGHWEGELLLKIAFFGALKGALDGGLDIPHNEKRFVGFGKDNKQLDAEVHCKYIYGGHVASYMNTLIEDEREKYQTHFSEYIKRGIEADNIEELYKKVHATIRADSTPKKSEKKPPMEHKRYNLKRLTYEERKAKLINALNSAVGNDDDGDDDE
ncbi:ribosomal protein L5 [Perilla frutescens var. frutescens]|nr:ribosomal protein L5 [Perilla frutescens var. frutescens]